MKAASSYDYVIVGGGSAGCVLANRLSASGAHRVLLLEAGPRDSSFNIRFPGGIAQLIQDRKHNWMFWSEPQPHLGNRRIYCPRGKTLGGSSAINAMCYMRGHASDYDGWAAAGCEGWSFAEVLPYFRKSENHEPGEDALHGVGGPLNVSARVHPDNPLSNAFLAAAQAAGHRYNADISGATEGVGIYRAFQKNGERCSNAAAYLRPAEGRANLTVITGAQASGVIFDGTRAAGVRYRRRGRMQEVRAQREVLLAAGAIQSPQLLMLSGIGPRAELAQHGVQLVHEAPGVGANLQDHLDAYISWRSQSRVGISLHPSFIGRALKGLWQYVTRRRGELTTNLAETGGFIKTAPGEPVPDIQWHFMPTVDTRHALDLTPSKQGYGFSLMSYFTRPYSRGRITLASADPFAAPRIDFNYGHDERDLLRLVAAVKRGREVFAQSAFDEYRFEELKPGAAVRSDADLLAWVRENAETAYHPVGTCRMGGDAESVVDPQLRVRGVQNLRVIDASVMPTLVGGNTNAPTTMIAEKGADLVLRDAA